MTSKSDLLSFRLTETARSLLAPDAALPDQNPAQDNSSAILVQPNFEVLVLQPDSRVLWTLMRVADLVRHDRVSAYTINKESVLRAVEAGLSPEEIVRFLDTNTGKRLPQNVSQSICDWARLIKHANIRRLTIIEVEDPAVLDELMASRKTRKFLERRISPTVAVAALPDVGEFARDDAWDRLMKDLRNAGYVPHFSDESRWAGHGSHCRERRFGEHIGRHSSPVCTTWPGKRRSHKAQKDFGPQFGLMPNHCVRVGMGTEKSTEATLTVRSTQDHSGS